MDLKRFNNPAVVLSSKVRMRVHELGLSRFRKMRFLGKRARRKVKEKCRKRASAMENVFSESVSKAGRHKNQKTRFTVVFGLQNI